MSKTDKAPLQFPYCTLYSVGIVQCTTLYTKHILLDTFTLNVLYFYLGLKHSAKVKLMIDCKVAVGHLLQSARRKQTSFCKS